MAEVRVVGAQQFAEVAARIKLHGDRKPLLEAFYRGMFRAAKPLPKDVRAAARARLPHRGGLAAHIATSKIIVSRQTRGAGVGVRIKATSDYNIAGIDEGRVRHLVYGHRPWTTQQVHKGFWTDPLEAGAPAVQQQMIAVLDEIAAKITE